MTQGTFARKLLVLVATVGLLSGCGSPADDGAANGASAESQAPRATPSASSATEPPPSVSPFKEGVSYAATAKEPQISVHESPEGPTTTELNHPQASGAPLTFLIKGHEGDWLEVYLPTRPNGVTGWISDGGVDVSALPYSLEVSTADNELTLYKSDELVQTFSVATGTGCTPTPHGTFYLTELIAPINDGYGPYAYGLSAFSEVLSEFGGGPGQIGLHGTDDAASIGQAVSHGCIRLSNADITQLATLLPLGTPIQIS